MIVIHKRPNVDKNGVFRQKISEVFAVDRDHIFNEGGGGALKTLLLLKELGSKCEYFRNIFLKVFCPARPFKMSKRRPLQKDFGM